MLYAVSVGPLGTNAYIVTTSADRCIVVDPGADASVLIAKLDALGLTPDAIALTHGHPDHTGGLRELLVLLAGRSLRPPVAIHARDAAYLGHSAVATNRKLMSAIGAPDFLADECEGLPEADMLLADGDELPGAPGLRVLHTPGHSAGSCCFYDADRGFVLSGDTLFRSGVGRTDAPDSDEEALLASIRTKLLSLPPSTGLYPGHGPVSTIGTESRWFR